jgi:hypothetical protein
MIDLEPTAPHNKGDADGRRYAPPLIAKPLCDRILKTITLASIADLT